MHRLMEIKERLEVIETALDKQHPHYRADPEITGLITTLKDYVESERKKIHKQQRLGELTELESSFIEPAINDVYLSSLDKIRRGSKLSSSVNGNICDTSFTLSYWLDAIRDFENKKSG